MAKLNLDYYSGDNRYSDGDIEEVILKIVKEGTPLNQLGKVEFPILYHLSAVRENILNWYPFRKEASCLEIGSGCGAITRLLCEKMKKVTSVELSRRRAEINFVRHQEHENLEIMVGNLNDMVFPKKFDYIILNGVFEYAMSFTPGKKPCEDFLAYVADFLKEDGILLIAIENRLGLKYFAGAPEDHTNAYMDGLRGYPGNESVRTFSKGEWEKLMAACGLNHFKFYYPYPDYKFPCEIFTDETLISQNYGRKTWNFTENRFELFSEHEMAATLRQEGVADRFANSFLIEMGKNPIKNDTQVLYAKLNSDRSEDFAICTTIEKAEEKRQVVKRALTDRAISHIERMAHRESGQNEKYHLLEGTAGVDFVRYPWLPGESLGTYAAKAIQEEKPELVKKLVRDVYDQCLAKGSMEADYETKEFGEVFGMEKLSEKIPCICPANIDLILDNLFPVKEEMLIIDGEWIFDFPVPATFIIWRTINEIYTNSPWFEKQLARKEFLQEYGIDEEMARVFWIWATHFEKEYVKANGLAAYAIPEIGVSLEEMRIRRMRETYLDSTLYLDTGNGFSEAETLKVKTRLEHNQLAVTFKLPRDKQVQRLRFDPLEGSPSLCSFQAVGAVISPENAVGTEEGMDLFITTDPAYRVEIKGSVPEFIHITGFVKVKEKDWALQKCQQMIDDKTGRRWKFWR